MDYVRGSNIYVRGYLDLRTWSLRPRALTEKNHYVKVLFSSRERCFSLRWIRGIHAIKRRACPITSERHLGKLGVRCLSTLNRGQDSRRQSQTATASHHAPTGQSVLPCIQVCLSYPKDKEKPPPTDVTSSVSGGYPVGYFLSDYAYSL